MANKVGIGIEAQLDTSAVEQQINAFGQRVAQANKVQFNPVSLKSVDDLKKLTKETEEYLKVADTLRRRIKDTGQTGKSIFDLDWERMFPNRMARISQMQRAASRVLGGDVFGGADGSGGGAGWGAQAGRVAQAGLRGAGPVGGVAANALGTGMSAGFGAGLMGLLGGVLALGVGKLVSSATEKIGAAEDQNVALDRLKRNLGDVNVSFAALKEVVHGNANRLRITYQEAGQLATQFTKLGNVSSDKMKELGGEVGVGVGLSKSFGLDPSQGVGVLGTMRGLGVTSNLQESRRFALLIGETIGKSGAFAKADEVMDALSQYTTAQTRSTLGGANTEGYAGLFSALVGSGIKGLDPANASAILGRANSALAGGGAFGEASQFLTARVGSQLGLDPLQTRFFREGGMFATKRSMFGEGSMYARYSGGPMAMGADADTTFWEARVAELQRDPVYGNNKNMMALAMANDTGVSAQQAMALLSVGPGKMGQLSKFADLSTLNEKGIGGLLKAQFGTAADRRAMAGDYWSRTGDAAISEDDRKRLRGAAGNDDALKQVLSDMAVKYDQQQTVGKDVHESKALLENIKINMADKLVPYMNDMRFGILSMAGVKDGKSPSEIMGAVLEAEKKDRLRSAAAQHGGPLETAQRNLDAIRAEKERITLENRKQYGKYTLNPELYQEELKKLNELEAKATEAHTKAKNEYTEVMKKVTQDLDDGITDNKLGLPPGTTAARRGNGGAANNPYAGALQSVAPPSTGGSVDAKLAAAEQAAGLPAGVLRSVIAQETGGKTADYLNDPAKYHYGLNAQGRRIAGHTGRVSTAFGPFGILESTAAKPGYGVTPLKDKSLDEQIRFASEYLAARARSSGSLEAGLAGYGEGSSYSGSVIRRMGRTQMPLDAMLQGGNSANGFKVTADPIVVRFEDQNGNERQTPQTLVTKVGPARPFGASAQ